VCSASSLSGQKTQFSEYVDVINSLAPLTPFIQNTPSMCPSIIHLTLGKQKFGAVAVCRIPKGILYSLLRVLADGLLYVK
jgi:hypothetical protein